MVSLCFATPATLIDTLSFEDFGLANATTAQKTGLGSVYKNPAGLISVDQRQFSTSYGTYLEDLYKGYTFGIATPLRHRDMVVAFTVPVSAISNIPRTVESGGRGVQTGSGSDTEWMAINSIAWKMSSHITMGASATYYRHEIFGESVDRVALDVGSIVDMGSVSLGASVTNMGPSTMTWSTGYEQESPSRVNVGATWDVLSGTTLLVDTSMTDDSKGKTNVAASTQWNEYLAIQGGVFDVGEASSFRLGTSLAMGDFVLTYSYGQVGELGSTQKFGVTFKY